MINKVTKDRIKSSEFSEWSFISQVRCNSNQIYQMILNCKVKNIRDDEVIFHEISKSNENSVSLNFSNNGVCRLLVPEEENIVKSEEYSLIPIKKKYEKHIHIIDRDNTRQLVINNGSDVDSFCLLSQDDIELKVSKNSLSKRISISGSEKRTSFSSFNEIISDLNILGEKINSKAWDNIGNTSNSISIRLYDYNEFSVSTC